MPINIMIIQQKYLESHIQQEVTSSTFPEVQMKYSVM